MKEPFPTSSIDNPLAWFVACVLQDGYDIIHKQFKAYAREVDGYFMPINGESDFEDEYNFYVDKEVPGNMLMMKYTYSHFFEAKVLEQYGIAVYNLDRKSDSLFNKEKDTFYDTLISIILSLQEVTNKRKKDVAGESVNSTLHNLATYIESKKTEVNEEVKKESTDIFGYKRGTRSIPNLYRQLVDIGFFDEEDDQCETFIKVLTRFNSDSKCNLKIGCDNGSAAYVFKRLNEKLFHNLTFSQIEESKIFKNKKGKTIVATDLSKALNTYNKKIKVHPEITEKVDEFISTL